MNKLWLVFLLILCIPLVNAQWSGNILSYFVDSSGSGSIDDGRHFYVNLSSNTMFFPGQNDDYFTSFNISTNTPVEIQSWASSANPYSLDGCRSIAVDDRGLAYIAAYIDYTVTTINISNPAGMLNVSNYTSNSGSYAITDTYDTAAWKYNNQYYVAAVGTTSDSVVVFNATGVNLVPIGNYSSLSLPCSTDDPRDIEIDLDHMFMYIISITR